jgi:hypothetical protein
MMAKPPFLDNVLDQDGKFKASWVKWLSLLVTNIDTIDGGTP